VGAHEQDRLAAKASTGIELVECVSLQVYVASSLVAARSLAGDQPDILEHVEVVGEQVRLGPGQMPQLDRGSIRFGQLVDDRQADRITRRGVPGGADVERGRHTRIMSLKVG
jgi:hypothetical protein